LEVVQLAAFASIALIGELLRHQAGWIRLAGACVASSLSFFVISNFGVWLGWNSYAHTWQGLVQCYVAAIPWYRQTLISTLIYAGLFFGCYEIYAGRGVHKAVIRLKRHGKGAACCVCTQLRLRRLFSCSASIVRS